MLPGRSSIAGEPGENRVYDGSYMSTASQQVELHLDFNDAGKVTNLFIAILSDRFLLHNESRRNNDNGPAGALEHGLERVSGWHHRQPYVCCPKR